MKGDFENIEDAWQGLMDAMLKKLADSAADMIASWMETNVTMSGISATSSYVTSGLSALGGYALGAAADFLGLAVGQWMVPEDKIAKLHAGEMVVPADYAGMVRDFMATSGGYVGPDANFSAGLAAASPSFMDTLNYNQAMDHIGNSAALGGVKGGIAGLPGGLAGFFKAIHRGGDDFPIELLRIPVANFHPSASPSGSRAMSARPSQSTLPGP